jgi:hypothetical protein
MASRLNIARPSLHATVASGTALLVLAGTAWAAIPDSGGMIHGCYKTSGGTMRAIDTEKAQKCAAAENPLQWNKQYSAGAGLTLSKSVFSIANGSVTGPMLKIPMSVSSSNAKSTTPMVSLKSNTNGVIANPASAAVINAGVNNTNSVAPALYGSVNSIFGNNFTAGVGGEATGTGGYGVYAAHTNSTGFGRALYAQTLGEGTAVEFETANTSNSQPTLNVITRGTGAAAQFEGSVNVTGNLSVSGAITAGVKDFKIDDPTDPANKYLIHTSVESPQAENVYNGNVTTDSQGYATVSLPPYFDAANTEPRYQLTAIGSFARAVVWQEEHNNQFVIHTDQPQVKVSWQVTGVRNDPYARSQRGPAEQPKPAADRGRYLYPQGYGQAASQAIGTSVTGTTRVPSASGRPSQQAAGNAPAGASAPIKRTGG